MKNTLKLTIALVLVASMVLGMVGCFGEQNAP